MEVKKEIVGRECKFATHLYKTYDRPDTHVIKEVLHYSDGTTEPNLRIVKDFKRPFYILNEHNRRYKDKREVEDLAKCTMYTSTQSDLAKSIASRLGGSFVGNVDYRRVSSSPYVYGSDISSTAILKYAYMKKYEGYTSKYTLATYDFETDVTGDYHSPTIASIAMEGKMLTIVRRDVVEKFLSRVDPLQDMADKLTNLYDKYIPECKTKNNLKVEYRIVEDELDVVTTLLETAHKWKPDFLAAWNANYDITVMIDTIIRHGFDPKDYFSDPDLPIELRHFKYKKGPTIKKKADGSSSPIGFEEQWHNVITPASFFMIDAAAAHRYVRVGQHSVAGGYSLNNILTATKIDGKLKFKDFTLAQSIDWHKYMSKNKPLEYITYNQWDVLSMLELDMKTLDLSNVLPLLSMWSDFTIFNSGPKKIVDALHYFYLDHGKVIGVFDATSGPIKHLGLGKWVVTLPAYRIMDNGLKIETNGKVLSTKIRFSVADADCVSSYPNCTLAGNVSKATTTKEILAIEGIEKEDFKTNNINLVLGKVNSIEYMTNMHNFETTREMISKHIEYTQDDREAYAKFVKNNKGTVGLNLAV
jgi:hypothetical protein